VALRKTERFGEHWPPPSHLADDTSDRRFCLVALTARRLAAEGFHVDPGEPFEETPYVVAPALLAVGKDVEPRFLLHAEPMANGRVLGRLQVGARRPPRREQLLGVGNLHWLGQAADDGRAYSCHLVTAIEIVGRMVALQPSRQLRMCIGAPPRCDC